MNTIDCIRELTRKYAGTYFFFRKPGESQESLVLCSNIETRTTPDGHVQGGVMQVNSLDCGRLLFNVPSEHTIVFRMPPVGVWQFGKLAVSVLRAPQRQWRRGICPDNTNIIPTVSHLVPCDLSWTLELVDAVFKRKTFTVQDALKMLDTQGYVSVAVGNSFSLARATGKNTYHVIYRTNPVGLYNSSTGVVSDVPKMYRAQVAALFKKDL